MSVKNPFLSLLDSLGRASEDDTTFSLAECLRLSPQTLQLYLSFLFDGAVPPEVRDAQLCVIPQYTFSPITYECARVGSRGRIDLALIDRESSVFVGVEYKVRDAEKPSRLHNYRLLMNAEARKHHWLFEIVQKREHEFPDSTVVTRVHTWNAIHEFFINRLSSIDSTAERQRLGQYCEFLAVSATTSAASAVRKLTKHPAYGPESRVRPLFKQILENVSVASSVIMADKNLPLHLRVQGHGWDSRFPGQWHQRIWVYAKLLDPLNPQGPTYPLFHIIFHNANFTNPEYAAKMFPRWAPLAAKAGLVISRGPAKGWDGKKGARLQAPWTLDCSPKYFLAEENENSVRRSVAGGCDDDTFVFEASERLKRWLSLVDSFPA